jgi:DNA polymerase-3 subunit delta
MQVTIEALPRHLSSELKRLYVVYGDAPLLVNEAADSIRMSARHAGFNERETLIAEQYFKWDTLRNCAQSLSLFAERRVIDLRIPGGKPGIEGAQALQEYASHPNDDILTLITLPKLDWSTQKSQWFTTLQSKGVTICADDIPRSQLPNWLTARLNRQEQSTDTLTLAFLSDRCEGNLLAAFQEVQKLALLYPAGALSFAQVEAAVMDVSRYDVFKLSEAMLAGEISRFAHILEGLRDEGTATMLILWALSEEIRTLGKLLTAIQRGEQIRTAMRDLRVRREKLSLVENAARRINLSQVRRAIGHAARLDKMIKGLLAGDVWDDFLQLGLRFAKS